MKNRKILITGGSGYIGQHLAFELYRYDEYNVTVLDTKAGKVGNTTYWRGSIEENVRKIEISEFTDIYHLASISSVRNSQLDYLDYYNHNVGSTVNLLKAIKQYKNKPNLYFSSSCTVYGNNNQRGVVLEETPTDPISHYGETKLLCEQLINEAVECGYVRKAVSLRFFNVIGCDINVGEPNGVKKGRIVPNLIRAALGGHYFTCYGNPESMSRDYIDVNFLCNIMRNIMEHVQYANHTYVIGTGKSYTTKDIISIVRKIADSKIHIEYEPKSTIEADHVCSHPLMIQQHFQKWGLDYMSRTVEDSIEDMYKYYQKYSFQ